MRDLEQMVESILSEKAIDATQAAIRMDRVLNALNELRKITRSDAKIDKDVRKLEDQAKKIAIVFNKMHKGYLHTKELEKKKK